MAGGDAEALVVEIPAGQDWSAAVSLSSDCRPSAIGSRSSRSRVGRPFWAPLRASGTLVRVVSASGDGIAENPSPVAPRPFGPSGG